MVLPRFAGRTEEARIKRAEAEIFGTLATALDMYELDMGAYPERIRQLWEKPLGADERFWKGPYIKGAKIKGDSILDPWGNPYEYESTEAGRSYRLSSRGSKADDPSDDIISTGGVTIED